jgi:hypothetical protein
VNRSRTLVVWMWCAGLVVACSGTFRFDDHSIPSGDGGADATAESPAGCDGDECGFIGQPCGSASCLLHCPHGEVCTGRCDSACTADCEEDAICTLTAGEGADLECEAGARCSFVAGRASLIDCRTDSDCGTRCLESCTLSCAPTAICALACGASASLMTVSGTAACP